MTIFDVLLYLLHGDIKLVKKGYEVECISKDSSPVVIRDGRMIKVCYPDKDGYVEYFTFIT